MQEIIQEIIEELEELEEKEWMDTVACIEKLRRQYPDSEYKKIVFEIVQEQSLFYDKHIQKKRDEYSKINNFIDRQKYYNEILSVRELGYKTVKQNLNRYLQKPNPKVYEAWVTPTVYDFMKENGYRRTLEFYISLGVIINKQ